MKYGTELLNGIKVVELATILAGPSVGMFFAELGAEVIKVENPKTGGDATRTWKTAHEDQSSPISAYYASINWGKKVVFHDLKSSEGHQNVMNLLKEADVLIYNFKAGDEFKLGLDYETLKAQFQRLIIGHISGYELDDHRPAFDLVLQAETGFISINGNPETGPVKMPLPLIDIMAAHQIKEALLAGLVRRSITQTGCYFHVSLYDSGVASLVNMANNVLMGGMDPGLTGSLHPNISPYGETIVSEDGESFILAVGNDHQFHGLCQALNAPETIVNQFSTNPIRIQKRKELDTQLNALASKVKASDLDREMLKNGVPFGRVKSIKQVVDSLPESYFLRETMEGKDTVRIRSAMFRIQE